RTPMNGIIGVTSLLKESKLTNDQIELLDIINVSGGNLLLIINDILDFSKIDKGMLKLEEHAIELKKCILESISLLNNQALERNIKLNYKIDPLVPDFLIGDYLRIKQILINLLNNAVKFTQNGEIIISATIKEKKGDDIMLLFAVKDNGVGISKELIPKIFDSFTQGSATKSNNSRGTGLGLAISKKLSHLMGGEIWLESKKNIGSTFFFTIKTKPANIGISPNFKILPTNKNKRIDKNLAIQKPLNILIAEDNLINQIVAKKLIEAFGYNPTIVNNGLEVLEILTKEKFDIIFMDIIMPKMGGVETTKKILSSYPDSERPKIIAMTANALIGDKEKYLAEGMDGYISKPIMPDKIENIILTFAKN
ncbi:MAG: ATP-binding protein, partial [Flavobacteriaceae bacterium]|nr:ATP-binding protein [Flavobacteriaceae bacterium]